MTDRLKELEISDNEINEMTKEEIISFFEKIRQIMRTAKNTEKGRKMLVASINTIYKITINTSFLKKYDIEKAEDMYFNYAKKSRQTRDFKEYESVLRDFLNDTIRLY